MLSVSCAIWPGENEGVELGASPRVILLKLISDGLTENVGCGLGAACWETAISAPERHEPVMVAVADLLVGDDVDVNYAGSGEYFPGRLLESSPVSGRIALTSLTNRFIS